MANQSFMSLPSDLSDPVVLRRVIALMQEEIDKLAGNRGTTELEKRIEALEEKVNS